MDALRRLLRLVAPPPALRAIATTLLTAAVLLVAAQAEAKPPVATRNANIDTMCPRMVHQVFENYVPFGNLSAGNYTLAPADRRLWPCVLSCCAQPAQCNVAFMVAEKCYHVQCVSNELCMPHRHDSSSAINNNATASDQAAGSKSGEESELRMVLVRPVDGDVSWLSTIKQSTNLELNNFDNVAVDADMSGAADILYADDADERRPKLQPPSANDDALQMAESAIVPAPNYAAGVVRECLLDDSLLASRGCVAHEVCVQLAADSLQGVCDCAVGSYRTKRGSCIVGTSAADVLVDDDDAVGDNDVVQLPEASEMMAALTATPAATTTTTTQPPPAAAAAASKPLIVSVLSKDVRLPEREVTLAAYTISDDLADTTPLHYLWSLEAQPANDVNGTMSDRTRDTIQLTNLAEGLYRFRVRVTAANRTGEAVANVTVLPQKRINRAPQVIITPAGQTIKLPTAQAILDGSTSTDDAGIVAWHWALIQGPIGYHPQLPDISTLQLADLHAPGNYTFQLTLTDTDGAQNASTAYITVLKANDYPPEANAGSDVILYLPDNHVTLDGSLSTDDREITRWEWTKDASVVSKAVDMQNTSTPFVELSNLQEGIYAFKLKVSDASNQSSTATVHVFVKPAPANRAPLVQMADGGNATTVRLPQTWVQLNGTVANEAQVHAVRFEWQQVDDDVDGGGRRAPNRAHIEAADRLQANATGLTVGRYCFRLSAWTAKEGGVNGSALVWVTVVQEENRAPVANAGGDQTLVMPVRQIVWNGSRSADDLGVERWEWLRDESSVAVGTVVAGTERQPVMILTNIYPGRYVFQLRVSDAQGLTATDTASVIVHPDPLLQHLVELTLAADVTRWRQSERQAVEQRLLLLFGDGCRVRVRDDPRPDAKRAEVVLVFYVEQPAAATAAASSASTATATPTMVPMDGRYVERLLAQRFRREPDILGTAVTDVRTSVCQNECSGHGVCQADTRACACDAFWMADAFWYWGLAAEANCNWSILYVAIGVLVAFLSLTLCCCGLMRLCRRDLGEASGGMQVKNSLQRSGKRLAAKAQKYSPLGTQDDEIPTLTQSAGTLSDTDTDSDVVFESSSGRGGLSALRSKQATDIEAGTLRVGGNGGGKGRSTMTRLGRRLRT